jgi:hypothetical protein
LPRTTIYYWVRDLPLSRVGRANAGQRRGNRAMQRKYRLLREAAYREGVSAFDELAADPTFRDFICLYIAEGSKRCRNTVAICNSDPGVMRIATRWICRMTEKSPEFSIQYHADQDLNDIRKFWGGTLGIDPDRIKLLRKSNSNQLTGRTWRSRHGVLGVRVQDTLLRARLQAWIGCVSDAWQ